jgi:hypothetical protein
VNIMDHAPLSAALVQPPPGWLDDASNAQAIFRDHAQLYWDVGLNVIPLMPREKRPAINSWQTWGKQSVPAETQAEWLERYPHSNIGLPAGPASGICFIDIDANDPAQVAAIEKCLPTSPWRRVGAKGCVLAFKFNGAKSFKLILSGEKKPIVEFFSTSGQVVLPPSIHPDTGKPYRANAELYDVLDRLPALDPRIENVLREKLKANSFKLDSAGIANISDHVSAGGRDTAMIQQAGLFATDITRGRKTLLEALNGLSDWAAQMAERVDGDEVDIEKGLKRVVEFLVNDIIRNNRAPPKGWDAGITDEQRAEFGLDALDEITYDPNALKNAIEELNRDYAVVAMGNKVFIMRHSYDPRPTMQRHRLEYFRPQDFFAMYANRFATNSKGKRVLVAKGWFESANRRQFLDGVILAPGMDAPASMFNLWRGFSVEPKEGDWTLLRDHIFENVCSKTPEWFAYLLNWMARLVQQPGETGQVALVFRGKEGVGKGTVVKYLSRVMREHYVHATNAQHVTGRFSAHLIDCILLFADEACFAGDPRNDSLLKGMITEETTFYEGKNRDGFMAPNYKHIIMATNDKWAIRASREARRYFVLDVGDAQIQNTDYFGRIDKQMMQGGGLAAMLFDLLNRDISEFNVWRIPETPGLVDQKLRTLQERGGVEAWLLEVLTDGEFGPINHWGDEGLLVARDTVSRAYDTWVTTKTRARGESKVSFGKALVSILGDAITNGDNIKLPIGLDPKRSRAYKFPSLHECRQAFMKSQNVRPWDGEEDVCPA